MNIGNSYVEERQVQPAAALTDRKKLWWSTYGSTYMHLLTRRV